MRTVRHLIKVPSRVAAFFASTLAFGTALPARAIETGLEDTAKTAGLDTSSSIEGIVGTGITQVLGLVGILFLILMIASGVMWMTAGGSEEKVSRARKIMTGAVVGLIIVFSSLVITRTVFQALGQ